MVARIELEGAAEDRVAHLSVGTGAVAEREEVPRAAGDRLDRPEADQAETAAEKARSAADRARRKADEAAAALADLD